MEPGHRKAARGKTRVRMSLSPPAGAAAGGQAADRCVGLDPRGPDPPPLGPLPPARRAAHVQLPGPGGRHQLHTRPPPALTLQGPLRSTTEGDSVSRERAGDRESFAALAAGGFTRASAHRPRAGRSRELEPRPRARRVTGRAERALGAQRAGAVYGRGGAGSAAQARPCFLAVAVLWFRLGQFRLVSSVPRVSACLACSAPGRPSPAGFGSRPSSKGFLCAAGQAGVLAEELPPQPHNLDLDQPEAVLGLPGVPPHLKPPLLFLR